MSKEITVSEFVQVLRKDIRYNPKFKNVALSGELSNFTSHQSGHFYFTLKDDKSRLDCVMFSSHTRSVLFKPENGDKLVVQGSADVYYAGGKLQFYVTKMNLDGFGDLHIQYEKLKKKLYKQGLFDQNKKKQLSSYPAKIAIITGKESAAYYDIKKTLSKRWSYAKQDYYFAYVQGDKSSKSVMEKLKIIDRKDYDVIILSRGGGSIEDLWSFNNEELVYFLTTLKTPIICAIGHESDETLVELVADVRAATPTDAAVVATPNRVDVQFKIRQKMNQMYLLTINQLNKLNKSFDDIVKNSYLMNYEYFFSEKQEHLDKINHFFFNQITGFNIISRELQSYQEKSRKKIEDKFNYHSNLNTQFSLNTQQTMRHLLNFNRKKLELFKAFIQERFQQIYRSRKNRLSSLSDHIYDLSPKSILKKGYIYGKVDNKIIKSIEEVKEKDVMHLYFVDGYLEVTVNSKGDYGD